MFQVGGEDMYCQLIATACQAHVGREHTHLDTLHVKLSNWQPCGESSDVCQGIASSTSTPHL